MDHYYNINYIVVGDTAVGKSCLILNFLGEGFKQEHSATVGIDFGSRIVCSYGKKFKLLIWDTAGQEAFNSIARSYYKGAAGALLVYDITQRETFNSIKQWIDDIKEYGDNNLTFVLIGNKSDLEDERRVSYAEGEKLANEFNMLFLETSARSGQNVEESFLETLRIINEKVDKGLVKVKKVEETHKLKEVDNGEYKKRECTC